MEPLSRDELGSVLATISEELEAVEEIIRGTSAAAASFLTESATYLTRAGGKRLRPALAIFCAASVGAANESVLRTAAAIEMTHLATLYHDDVIDEADTRRGVPSANDRWGNKVAILAGDYLFARASHIAAEVGGEVPGVLADAIAQVVTGQVTELRSTYDAKRSFEAYIETIDGKTASLIDASARLGATLGGGSLEQIASLRRFGRAFGFAFQVADDLLDLAATAEALGKPPGTDLREGVYTLPVIFAAEAEPELYSLLGTPEVDVDEVRSIVITSGGFERARATAVGYEEDALRALAELPAGEARSTLEKIARLVVDRVPGAYE